MFHLGSTRSASRRDYLLQTPDTFVRTPLPGLARGMAIVHAAPGMGAAFSMMTVEFQAGGTLDEGPGGRFVYVLEGSLLVSGPVPPEPVAPKSVAELQASAPPTPQPRRLPPGGFAFFPTGFAHGLTAEVATRALVLERLHDPLPAAHRRDPHADHPTCLLGDEPSIAPTPLAGDPAIQVRALLPASISFDLAVNTMTYLPGASLAQVEVHYMEHGLLMLEGSGLYRLGEDWYPVTAGDFIWMAPFCPQWFAALGKTPSKYLIYKDVNRHVIA